MLSLGTKIWKDRLPRIDGISDQTRIQEIRPLPDGNESSWDWKNEPSKRETYDS